MSRNALLSICTVLTTLLFFLYIIPGDECPGLLDAQGGYCAGQTLSRLAVACPLGILLSISTTLLVLSHKRGASSRGSTDEDTEG